MPEYLEDPSVLTKDKLKNELLANNVELPSGNPTKDVYVQLYLDNLTVQNMTTTTQTLDAFSSDEELPPPVVSNRSSRSSRSSGRKATRKTDKVLSEELDVTELPAEGLRDELVKYGVDAGPIVASTRKLYEKKLQKLMDEGPPEPLTPQVIPTEIDANLNGNSDSDHYSDKEDDEPAVPVPEPVVQAEPEPEPEPEPVPEPAPVVERPLRSRGKVPVTTRARSSQHNKMDEPVCGDKGVTVKRSSRRSTRVEPILKPWSNNNPLKDHWGSPDPTLTTTGVVYTWETPHIPPKQLKDFRLGPLFSPANKTDSRTLSPRPSKLVSDAALSPSSPKLLRSSGLPARIKSPSTWKKAYKENVHPPSPKPVKCQPHQPTPILHTAVVETVLPGEPCQLDNLIGIDPVTRRPFCNLSPIINLHQPSSYSAEFDSVIMAGCLFEDKPVPTGVHADARQQKITRFLSAPLSPAKKHGSKTMVPKDSGLKEVEKITASEEITRVDERDILKELFPNDMNSPTGISATCRRPIRGAAGRPLKPSDLLNDEHFLRSPRSVNTTKTTTSSYTESRSVHRVSALPPSSSVASRLTATTVPPPTSQSKVARRGLSLWIKLFLLVTVAAFLFFVYQAMETNTMNPFGDSGAPEQIGGGESAAKVTSK